MHRSGTLIIGAGLAGVRTATTLRSLGYDAPISLIGEEPHAPYERPALSKELLSGDRAAHDLTLTQRDVLAEQGIDLHTGVSITGVSAAGRATRSDGTDMLWERLVFATGARARNLSGAPQLDNVVTLRTIDDALTLRQHLVPGARLVIVGCGFVGAEVASTALRLGASVTVLEAGRVPFEPTLGPLVGELLHQHYLQAGVDVRTQATVERLAFDASSRRATAVVLGDGSSIAADVVLVAIGAIPNDELYHATWGGDAGRGIATNGSGATAHAGVYACGDVAAAAYGAGPARRIEHWTSAAAQASAVARAIVGAPAQPTAPPYVWSDQFNLRLQVVGRTGNAPQVDIVCGELDALLVRYLDEQGRFIAGLASNRPRDVAQWRKELIAA